MHHGLTQTPKRGVLLVQRPSENVNEVATVGEFGSNTEDSRQLLGSFEKGKQLMLFVY